METAHVFSIAWLVIEYAIKIFAIGTVPANRKPSSAEAWLLLILLLPIVGLPLFWLIGSPYVRGRRAKIRGRADQMLNTDLDKVATFPTTTSPDPDLAGVMQMNRHLTSLPCVTGNDEGLYEETREILNEMTAAVRGAQKYVHVEYFIMAWDSFTNPFFTELANAVNRGVHVRLLVDQLGSAKYPGWKEFQKKLTAAGIDWHLMMPIDPLRGRWRRPDLRNHRKLMIVDGTVGFMGSNNVINPDYDSAENLRVGRRWKDLGIKLGGDILQQLHVVFAVDWYTETGQTLDLQQFVPRVGDLPMEGNVNAMQLVPSGPGFSTEPNERMFTQLVSLAQHQVTITSPYFIPDDALLEAITSAAYRGVTVELFVGAESDQFIVGHAQRSYYGELLKAGVKIYLYPAPTVLHVKCLTVDGRAAALGSSNMDYRSFILDYEITLLSFGGTLIDEIDRHHDHCRAVSSLLTLQEWDALPWPQRYIDNVCRLTSALM